MKFLVMSLLLLAGEAAAQTASSVPAADLWVPGFRLEVGQCWAIDGLSADERAASVVVAVEFDQTARPIADSIRLIGIRRGSGPATEQLFASARRALLRCGSDGYHLPPAKFALWRRMELVFDPTGGAAP